MSIYDGMTPEEIEAKRARERERWNRRKDKANEQRRMKDAAERPNYQPNEAMKDENGQPLKGHNKNIKARVDAHYEMWTVEQIDELGTRMLKYMEDNEDAVWWKDFFLYDDWGKEQHFYDHMPQNLSMRSASFNFLFERVKGLQASRLLRLGIQGSKNTNFLEFILINMTDMKPRNWKETTNNNLTLAAPTKIELLPPQSNKVIDIESEDQDSPDLYREDDDDLNENLNESND